MSDPASEVGTRAELIALFLRFHRALSVAWVVCTIVVTLGICIFSVKVLDPAQWKTVLDVRHTSKSEPELYGVAWVLSGAVMVLQACTIAALSARLNRMRILQFVFRAVALAGFGLWLLLSDLWVLFTLGNMDNFNSPITSDLAWIVFAAIYLAGCWWWMRISFASALLRLGLLSLATFVLAAANWVGLQVARAGGMDDLAMLMFALPVAGPLLYLTRSWKTETTTNFPKTSDFKSGSYLSSARTLSLLLLATLALASNLAPAYRARETMLRTAREVFAKEYVAEALRTCGPRSEPAKADEGDLGSADCAVEKGRVTVSFARPQGYARFLFAGGYRVGVSATATFNLNAEPEWSTHFERDAEEGERPWHDLGSLDLWRKATVPKADANDAGLEHAYKELARIAREVEAKSAAEGETIDGLRTLYEGIEAEVTKKRVEVPTLGIEMESRLAMWIISGVAIGLLLLMRNQLRYVLRDRTLADEEPWLVLDGESGIEWCGSGAWLMGLLLSPWILHTLVVTVQASETVARGGSPSATQHIAICILLISTTLCGAWLSVTTVAKLYRLRGLRMRYRRQLPTDPGQSSLVSPASD
ncbi:MAG: hypothetical protein HYR72_19975 [Deltaproteobacteria bacterium]|nr:hypothetical protein [Deltaproteobacteria bacterium]MBI3390844.1 hypothetical protein [Deltaproteobacteria bacterium]